MGRLAQGWRWHSATLNWPEKPSIPPPPQASCRCQQLAQHPRWLRPLLAPWGTASRSGRGHQEDLWLVDPWSLGQGV